MDQFKARVCMSCLGVLVCSVSVGMFRTAALGVDPFQSFMGGLNTCIPISFGMLYIIANGILLLFSLLLDRHKIGIATVINLTLVGYVAEFSQNIFTALLPELGFAGRLLLLAVAVVVMCFGSALYFNADLGVSTYDAVSLILSEKQNKVSFKFCRIISDVICVALGVSLCLLGGGGWRGAAAIAGIGTIVTAFFMGPLISFFSGMLPFGGKKTAGSTGGSH